ncbi:hypothetical protein BCR32DRAFT_288304, partial [Anaeromyces robustus]
FIKWLHVILAIAHATGLVFLFLIYSIRYISQWVPPLRNYYLTLFGILIDFILILLLIIYKKKKRIEDASMSEIKVDPSGSVISSKKSTVKYSKNPQLISEGIATPLYQNGAEVVEHQPSVKPVIDQTKIVVSDNIVGNETYIDNNGNQFQYNPSQQMEVNIGTNYSPVQTPVNNQSLKVEDAKPSQYTYTESSAYPKASNTINYKIPEIPVIRSDSGTREISVEDDKKAQKEETK